jgi:hypothetical protein
MTALRIHLEDHGQSLHTFTLRDGRLSEANLEGWIWNGARVLNDLVNPGTILRLADERFGDGAGGELQLRYPVQSIFCVPDHQNTAPRHSRNAVAPGAASSSSQCRAGEQGGDR